MSVEGRSDSDRYDAFISYSHAADDLLAPRLQVGLQRFAKPWWKRRAMRVFRDESSLSASPHLWGSITEALDESSWFVLLLSPDSAQSHWVGQEIEYWIADEQRAGRVLPVVTDGEFSWVEGEVTGSAVHPALLGVFSSEPRWVNLRFARGEKQLDLKNPRFSEAVADLASAIRGVPKDELESEEVRQHRRTIRTAWAGAVLVLLLGVAASIASVFAFNEQQRANQQAALAIENAAEADTQRDAAETLAVAEANARDEADAQRAEAETQRANAAREATIARSQALVLEAEKSVAFDPELSMQLALAAIEGFRQEGQDTTQAMAALREAISRNRVLLSEDWEGPAAVDPSGTLLAHKSGFDVLVREIESGQIVYRCSGDINSGAFTFSPDGLLTLATLSQGIMTCDRSTGLRVIVGAEDVGNGPGWPVYSPDGRYFAWSSFDGVSVYSISENRIVYTSRGGSGPSFSKAGLLAYVEFDLVSVIDPVTGSRVRTIGLPGCCASDTAWSPDDSRIVASGDSGAIVVDAESGAVLSRHDQEVQGTPVWIPSLNMLVLGGPFGFQLVDPESGQIVSSFEGLGTGFLSYVVVPGTTHIAAGRDPDRVQIFDASPLGGTEVAGWLTPLNDVGQARFIADGSKVALTDGGLTFFVADTLTGVDALTFTGVERGFFAEELVPVVIASGHLTYPDSGSRWSIVDASTGEATYQTPEGFVIQGVSEDGSTAVIYSDETCHLVVDTADGSEISRPESTCDEGAHGRRFFFSPDNNLIVGSAFWPEGTTLFDLRSGKLLAGLDVLDASIASFSNDGSELLVVSNAGTLYVLEVEELLAGFSPLEATRLEILAHGTKPVFVAVSPDGSMAATSSLGEPLKLWDLTSGQLIDEFGGDPGQSGHHYGDFHPTEPWLLVVSPPNEVRIYTLDIDELIAIAESRLTRDLTDAECQQYVGACAQ